MGEDLPQSPRCLRFWCSGHRDDLALRDQWAAESTKVLLREFDTFFRSFGKCVNDSVPMADELHFFSAMLLTCYKKSERTSWVFPKTRTWNVQKPYICSLADDYPAYILFCQSQESSARNQADKARWRGHKEFLMKATTYLIAHILADCLQIYDAPLSSLQHSGAEGLALDVPAKIAQQKAALAGYILEKPSDTGRQVLGKALGENSVVKRAFVEGHLCSGKWHIQRGLERIGFRPGKRWSHMQLKVDSSSEASALPFQVDPEAAKKAFQ